MSDSCPFCARQTLELLAENDLAFAIRDKFPVRPLHTLVIPKRHFSDVFSATTEELAALHVLADECRAAIVQGDSSAQGFNFGSNIGAAAGQKIFHAHLHLIPRRVDEPPPPAAQPDSTPTDGS